MVAACCQAGLCHTLAESTFGKKGFFQRVNLLIQEVVGLMDQTDQYIGDNIAGAGFNMDPIGLLGHIVLCAQLSDKRRLSGVLFPKWLTASAQKIAIVFQ